MFACGVGQAQGESSLPLGEERRDDAGEKSIAVGTCHYLYRRIGNGVVRFHYALPEFQYLTYAAYGTKI